MKISFLSSLCIYACDKDIYKSIKWKRVTLIRYERTTYSLKQYFMNRLNAWHSLLSYNPHNSRIIHESKRCAYIVIHEKSFCFIIHSWYHHDWTTNKWWPTLVFKSIVNLSNILFLPKMHHFKSCVVIFIVVLLFQKLLSYSVIAHNGKKINAHNFHSLKSFSHPSFFSVNVNLLSRILV